MVHCTLEVLLKGRPWESGYTQSKDSHYRDGKMPTSLSCSGCWTSDIHLLPFPSWGLLWFPLLCKEGCCGARERERQVGPTQRAKEGEKQQSRHCFHFKSLWTEHLSLPARSSNNSREIKYRERTRTYIRRAETLILVLAFSSGGYAAQPPERPGGPRCPHRRRWLACAPRAGQPCIRARPRAARPAARTGRRAG